MELTIWMEAFPASVSAVSVMFIMLSNTLDTVVPEKMDITAGGASCPPSLYELLSVHTEVISRWL